MISSGISISVERPGTSGTTDRQDTLITQYLHNQITFKQYQEAIEELESSSSRKKTKQELRSELVTGETSDLLAQVTQALTGTSEVQPEEEPFDDDSIEISDDPMDVDYVPESQKQRSKKKKKKSTFIDPDKQETLMFDNNDTSSRKETARPIRALDPAQEALVGHANLCHAKGQSEEAIKMLEEIIKEAPYNPVPYQQLAAIHGDLGNANKALNLSLLAANLDYRTPGDVWFGLGEQCEGMGDLNKALGCFNKAVKADPKEWLHHLAKIRVADAMLSTKVSCSSRAAAAKHLESVGDFEWYKQLVIDIVEKLLQVSDKTNASMCLLCLLRRNKTEQPEVLLEKQLCQFISLQIEMQKFLDAAKAIFTFVPGLLALDENGLPVLCVPKESLEMPQEQRFPPNVVSEYVFAPNTPFEISSQLAVCWIRINRIDLAEPILCKLHQFDCEGKQILEITTALVETKQLERAEIILANLVARKQMVESCPAWLQYAQVLESLGKTKEACDTFTKVLGLDPGLVEARISLSVLQQQLGRGDEALETLIDDEWDTSQRVPDERLLSRQSSLYYDKSDWSNYLKTARLLLSAYFYDVHTKGISKMRKEVDHRSKNLCLTCLSTIRGSNLERFVKKIGPMAAVNNRTLEKQDLLDFCFKVCEVLFTRGKFADLLLITCYLYAIPALTISGGPIRNTVDSWLLLAAVHARQPLVTFEYLRNVAPSDDKNKLWNLFGLVFSRQPDVRFHKYIFRQAAKNPDCIGLSVLSANNSLVSGTYHHALAEYLSAYRKIPDNPLLCLLIAITFMNIGCKKDISRRNDICLHALAFFSKYRNSRQIPSEVCYNLGRAMQQLNIPSAAVFYYEKVLESGPIIANSLDNLTGEMAENKQYDLRPLAAHNLALIYKNAGNLDLARDLMYTYCVV